MDNNQVLEMLKEEIESKVDAETLERLKMAKTEKEALSILEEASVELNEEQLAAVAGGRCIAHGPGWERCHHYIDPCPRFCSIAEEVM